MSVNRWIPFLAFYLSILPSVAMSQPSTALRPRELSGSVRNSTSGQPLPGVTVLVSTPTHTSRETTTERGYFRFDQLSGGIYDVTFSRAGFVSVHRRIEFGSEQTEDGETVPRVAVTLRVALGPLPDSCNVNSLPELPEKFCDCMKDLRETVQSSQESLETLPTANSLIRSIWPDTYWRYGPTSIGDSPGWSFRIYRPDIDINFDSQRLRVGAKSGRREVAGRASVRVACKGALVRV